MYLPVVFLLISKTLIFHFRLIQSTYIFCPFQRWKKHLWLFLLRFARRISVPHKYLLYRWYLFFPGLLLFLQAVHIFLQVVLLHFLHLTDRQVFLPVQPVLLPTGLLPKVPLPLWYFYKLDTRLPQELKIFSISAYLRQARKHLPDSFANVFPLFQSHCSYFLSFFWHCFYTNTPLQFLLRLTAIVALH